MSGANSTKAIDVEVVHSGRVEVTHEPPLDRRIAGQDVVINRSVVANVSQLMTLAGVAAHTGERYRITFTKLDDEAAAATKQRALQALEGPPSTDRELRLAQTRATLDGRLVFNHKRDVYERPQAKQQTKDGDDGGTDTEAQWIAEHELRGDVDDHDDELPNPFDS